MSIFKIKRSNRKKILTTKLKGRRLLQNPRLNKGSAFSNKERAEFELFGLLPNREETLAEQSNRLYNCYSRLSKNLDKHVFLRNVRNQNETLYYYLIEQNYAEMLPIVYTPTIGEAVVNFSKINLQPRGVFLSYPNRKDLKKSLAPYKNYPIKIAVITDGEGVLGIGDQGAGGIHIAIAKGNLYALFAGMDPNEILPIQIDVGTNNQQLIADPNYLGWQHPRVTGREYERFVTKVIAEIMQLFPDCFIHWEDFARDNAQKFLKLYQKSCCTFNDDIQGTGAVTLATILAALEKKQEKLTKQTIIIYGAGSAGIGIAEQICLGMQQLGLTSAQARAKIWLIDRPGVLCTDSPLTIEQAPFAKQRDNWMQPDIQLPEVIKQTKATILIGCSGQAGHFTKDCILALMRNTDSPIIMPISNPTTHAEATPAQIIEWTKNKAFIATGSPFAPVTYKGQTINISQCNNMFIFPGIGRAVTYAQPKYLTQSMMMAACMALAKFTRKHAKPEQLLPDTEQCRAANRAVTLAVIRQAEKEGLNKDKISDLTKSLQQSDWYPRYMPYQRTDEEHD